MEYSGYQCPTPQVPSPPSVSPNPSADGNVNVTVTNGDYYSWIELNIGGTSRNCFCTNPTISRTLSPGSWSITARRCLTPDGSSIRCSNYSSPTTVTVLSTPAAPSITAVSPNACGASVAVNWSAGSGNPSGTTLYYELNESLNGGSTWGAAVSGTTATSWSRSGASELNTYHYRVRAYYTYNGYTSYSNWSTASGAQLPQCPPAQPGAPSLSQPNPDTSTAVSISWGSVGTVRDYSLERSPNNSSWTSVCTTSGTSCSDSATLNRGATYYYRVRANKSTVSGPWSASSSIAIGYARPGTVSAPTFTGIAPYGYTVNWSSVSTGNTGPITYWLWENGTWTNVGSALSRAFTGRSPATNYEYKVQACNGGGLCSTVFPANTISFPGVPGAITLGSIADFGRGYIVGWGAAAGSVGSYELTRSTDGGQSWAVLANQDGVLLSESVSNSTAGTTYRYRVRACNSLACGDYGSVRQYWVPTAPALSTPTINTTNLSLSLSWPALTASHYQLDHSVNGGAWQSISTSYAQTSYTATVINGYTYSYRVRACNAEGGCSQNAESLNNAVPPGIPATITAAQPAADVRTDVTVNWSAITGLADGYYLERRNVTAGGSFAQIAQINGAGNLSYTDTGLQSNTAYQYRVRAFKGALAGGYSPSSSNLRIRYLRPTVNMFVSGASQQTADVYSAGYNGIYTLNWAAGTGTATSFNILEQASAGAWQAASLSALQCTASLCDYDKPFNNSGADNIYRYRGQACNVDYCSSEREIAVHVKTYPTPGPATNFTYQFTGTPSDGAYTLSWTAPASTPPNTTGPNAELVTHYRLARTAPTAAGPWLPAHSDTQTAPYTQAFTGGTSGQTYIYEIAACFTPSEPGATTVCSGVSSLSVRVPYAPPNQASGLNHTGLNAQTGSYTLQWTAGSGQVSYYEIERLLGEEWVYFATASAANHPVAGHPNGERRSYRVRACNVDACGDYTAAYEVYVPHLQPGVPSNLVRQSLDAPGRRLTLAWSAPLTGGQVQTYEVEQSADGGSTWQAAASTASATLTVNGLNGGTNYRFRVRACNVDACSTFSTQLTAYLPYAAPGTPGALSHNAAENNPGLGAFTARWTAPSAIDSALAPITYYQLEYSANSGGIWQAAPTGGATPGRINVVSPAAGAPASATLSGLATGAAYSVRVRACNADACGENTAAYQVYLPRPAPAAPVWLPTNPSASDYDARRFTIQWTPPATGTVSHYHLETYAGSNNGFDTWLTIAETPATGYAFFDRAYGETYRYRVRACSEPQSVAASCSAWALSGDIRLRYPVPKAPGGIVVSNQSGGSYTLNWNGVLGWVPEYQYELQENRNNAGWTTLATQTATTFNRTGRTAATYLYRVRTCNPAPDSDCGAWSPQATVTVLTTPGAPASINISTVDNQSCRYNVSWTPPTTGQGNYHYEFSRQINGGSWSSIAWTTGTSHNMIVSHANNGLPHNFRVRARSLISGQYSAWGGWRTGTATTTGCGTSYNSTTDQLYVSAPRYSSTGQYTVNMQYAGTAAPGFAYRYDVSTNGTWSSLGSIAMPPAVGSLVYDSSNARTTARYRYRISTCDYDVYPDNTWPNNERTCPDTIDSNWDTLSIDTTVLRAPGSVGTVRALGLQIDPVENLYLLPTGQFTLDWTAASGAPAPATLAYEIQYKPDASTIWMPWAEQAAVDLPVTLPEFGVAYDFRVRACALLDDYVNCGSWSTLNFPVKRSIGPPRFAADVYPTEGDLVIYDRNVPLQWLPPLNMAESGIDHYEISLRSLQATDAGELWVGPDVMDIVAPVTGPNSNPPVQQASVDVDLGGQKEFLIRACGGTASNTCGEALVFAITVVIPPEAPEKPGNLVAQPDPDNLSDDFNGALSGKFSVLPSGAASYDLPIIVPPGTAGVQPRISLSYNSQAGNGIAGWGWSLEGISSINRCSKTLEQDGVIRPVDYTDDDAYCLDGHRLIAIGGSQYRTEKTDFRRIEKKAGGVCGTWFEVKTQAGETLQYGNTADACINGFASATPVIKSWAINRVTDVTGNYMVYEYTEDASNTEFTLDRIGYTGHDGGQQPYTWVDFEYVQRPDPISGYRSGALSRQTQLLKRIETAAGAYDLDYAPNEAFDPTSRLQQITYCAVDPETGTGDYQCMLPLSFEWSVANGNWEQLPSAYRPPLPMGNNDRGFGVEVVDLDNDGLPDLLYGASGARQAYRNTGSGWQTWPGYQPPVNFVDGDGEDLGVRLADIDGNGYPDLVTSDDRGDGTSRVYRNTGSGWQDDASMALPEAFLRYQPRLELIPGSDNGLRLEDLDGDGLTDLIYGRQGTRRAWRNTGNSTNRWVLWPQYAPLRDIATYEQDNDKAIAWFADMNGDGRTDMISRESYTSISAGAYDRMVSYRVRLNSGAGWTETTGYNVSAFVDTDLLPDAGFRLADLNGDGLPDFIRGNRSDDIVRLNSGRGWVTPVEGGAFTGATPLFLNPLRQDNGQRFIDLNADGRTDSLFPGDAWLSVGSGWQSAPNFASPIRSYRTNQWALSTIITDVNGDGSTDIVFNHEGSGSGAWTNQGGRRQIVAVNDGLGNTTGIKYKMLTDRGLNGRSRPIYTRTGETLSTPREQEMNIPLGVVDRVTVNDGIGGDLTTEYAYKGLTAAQGGRGLQGFEEMTVVSPRGEVTTSRYARRYPFSGMPLSVEIRYGNNGPLLNRTTSEYCWATSVAVEAAGFASVAPDASCPAYDDPARSNESLFIYVKKTTIESHQLNRELSASIASTTTVTRNTFGRYGYLANSSMTISGDGHTYRTDTSNAYDSNADRYWLGRLTSATVTKTVDNVPDANSTRRTDFEYYTGSGLLWKEKVEPGAGVPLEQHTVHAYDQFGNIAETTVCAEDFGSCVANPGAANAGSPGRSATTVYDSRGRYPVATINALDQTESYEYEHPLGVQTGRIGPNGVETRWVHDALGRKKQEITPFGTTTLVYSETSGGYAPMARYAVQTVTPEGGLSRVYYDSLGRERRQLARNLFGEFVAADAEYDHFGRVSRSSAPYFVYNSVSGDIKWTINEYDTLGRPTRVQVPLGDLDADGADNGYAVSTTEVLPFAAAITDAKGRRKLTQKNALDQIVRVVDDEGGINVEVDYQYDSQGGLIGTTVDNNAATTITNDYDRRGNREWTDDPDMGRWDFQYNGYGELEWQRDAKGQLTEFDYDKLGRMTERRQWPDENNDGVLEAVQTSNWTYDTAPGAGIGKPHTETGPEASKAYSYTASGLLRDTLYQVDTASFTVSHTYDAFGRMKLTQYPQVGTERLAVENVYSNYGGLWYVQNPGSGPGEDDDEVQWIATAVDARGQVMQEFLRNQNVINNLYNSATGWLQKVESWDRNEDMIQQTRYVLDEVGSVEARARFKPWVVEPDGSFSAAANEEFIESFSYDTLDRLTGSTVMVNGVQTSSKSFDYDRLGNFLYKDSVGDTYTYDTCGAGPHAVCAAKGSNFEYDANGNMIASTGAKTRELVYGAFNKPIAITEGGATVEFRYGPDHARVYKSSSPDAQGLREITFYVGLGAEGNALYEQKAWINGSGTVVKREHQHFIYAGSYHKGQAFAMRAITEEGGLIRYAGSEYYHRDHLGSVIAITDDMGVLRDASGEMRATLLSFDAWGKLRNPDGSDLANGQYQGSRTNRLYTGHESVPEVGLIHMNGRVYDPELGVFLSPDSIIQATGMSQNYHRYSYAFNNPIRYNDPTGHWITLVIGVILAVVEVELIVAMAIMFAATYIETGGDLKAAIISALSVGIANGIGTAFEGAKGGWMLLAKSAVHGLTQGIFAEIQGGDFRDGFIGGFLGSLTGPIVPKGVIEGTLVSAMIGGTISELTGGKFMNGAKSAAIVHLFNQAAHQAQAQAQRQRIQVDQAKLDQAARDALNAANPMSIRDNLEYGGLLYRHRGQYLYTAPVAGAGDTITNAQWVAMYDSLPQGALVLGDYHTHGDYSRKTSNGPVRVSSVRLDQYNSDNYSRDDKIRYRQVYNDMIRNNPNIDGLNWIGYLGTPSGVFRAYDAKARRPRILPP